MKRRAGAPREPEQRTFDQVVTHGGQRKGAGRKPRPGRPMVSHVSRAKHVYSTPLHITLRCAPQMPSLRFELLHNLVKKAIADTRRDGFRIIEYSVQDNHLHLVVEAEDGAALTSGMRSFTVRVAMRVNATLRRTGRVWGDRYHRRDLGSPSEVRGALVYVLANHLKHGRDAQGLLDPCSSGAWFKGWMHDRHAPPTEPPAVEPARTWLLRVGWWERGGGFIHLGERPR